MGIIMAKFKYEIKKYIGTISTSSDEKVATEVNIISYNDAPEKVDIRSWNKETGRMYKGIALTYSEAQTLKDLLSNLEKN